MAISWGPVTQHMQLGIEYTLSPSSVTKDTSSVTETVKFYVKSVDNWYWNDNQILTIRGMGTSSIRVDYLYNANSTEAAQPKLISTQTRNAPVYYDSSNTEIISGEIGGIGNSTATTGGPKHSVTFTLPSRPPQLPSAPTNLSISRSSDTSVKLSWSAPSNATAPSNRWEKIEVQRQIDGGSWSTIATYSASTKSYDANANSGAGGDKYTLNSSATSYTDNTTTANHSYDYRVRATNVSGGSGYADAPSIYTTPAAPSNLKAVKSGSDIVLTWTDNSPGNTGWEVADNGTVIATITTNSPASYTVTNPSASQTHSYTVRAVAGSLVSPWSAAQAVQLQAPPNAPTNLSPSGTTVAAGNTQQVTWNHNPVDASAQSAFEVQYRQQGSSTWTSSGKTSENVNSYTVPAFPAGKMEWQVRTWGSHPDPSPWSAVASYTLNDVPVVTLTLPKSNEIITGANLPVSWTYSQAQGVSQGSFRIVLMDTTSGQIAWDQTTLGAATSSTVPGLLDGHSYTIYVVASTSSNLVSNPAWTTFTVDYTDPTPPDLTAVWDEGGFITVTGTSKDGLVATTRMEIQRSYNGSEWETVLSTTTFPAVFEDFTAPMVGVVTYRAISYAESGASAFTESVVTMDEESVGCEVLISGGSGFTQVVKLSYVTDRKYTGGRDRVLNQWSGRRSPIESSGATISKQMSITAKFFPSHCTDYSSRSEVEALFDLPGPHLYRDSSGRRMFCSLSDVSIDWDYLGETSFTATEVEEDSNEVLRSLNVYQKPRLVEVRPGEYKIVGGGNLQQITPAEWTWKIAGK